MERLLVRAGSGPTFVDKRRRDQEIVMRKIIAALQVSLDGFIEGPNEELDWVNS